MVRAQRERLVSSLTAAPLEDGRVDVKAVSFGHGRAEEGRTTGPPAAQAHAHGVPAAALPGHGRAQEGMAPKRIEGRLKVERPADPRMRGSNKNRNGRIRRYLPKRTGFDDLSDADLQAIVDEINDTPMKVLDQETSNEVWHRELGKVPSKTSRSKTNVALIN